MYQVLRIKHIIVTFKPAPKNICNLYHTKVGSVFEPKNYTKLYLVLRLLIHMCLVSVINVYS